MQYSYTSLKSVIGNVIRNTRIQDGSFIADIHEWLYEAMEQLETEFSLEGKFEVLNMSFHKAKLPCGLKYIDAIEYNGRRLKEGGGVRPASQSTVPVNYTEDAFQTKIGVQDFNGHTLYTATLDKVSKLAGSSSYEYYYTDMGHINTSFSDGPLTVYYRGIATDEDGFPMIPDNQNYKQALYWYCRGMMIGAGWKDTVFNYQYCTSQFEFFAGRALGEIRMPSPEQMEHRINTFVRFIPYSGYYDNFFQTSRPEGSFIKP